MAIVKSKNLSILLFLTCSVSELEILLEKFEILNQLKSNQAKFILEKEKAIKRLQYISEKSLNANLINIFEFGSEEGSHDMENSIINALLRGILFSVDSDLKKNV